MPEIFLWALCVGMTVQYALCVLLEMAPLFPWCRRPFDPYMGPKPSENGALSKLKGHTGAIFALSRGDVGQGSHLEKRATRPAAPAVLGRMPCLWGEDGSVRVWDLRTGGKCVWSVGGSECHPFRGQDAGLRERSTELECGPSSTATVVTGHEDGTCCGDLRGGRLL